MIVAIIFRPFGLLIYMLTYFLYILLLIHKLYIQKQNVQTVRQELSNTHLQSGQGKYYTGESNL
jgi:cell division protein FtsW (lipid II flippase)